MTDESMYTKCLSYVSIKTGDKVELHYVQTRRRYRWFHKMDSDDEFMCSLERPNGFRSKLEAIMVAAHRIGLSGADADFVPVL